MGSCVSSLHRNSASHKAKMSFDKSSIPSTPVKENPAIVDPPILSLSFKSRVSPLNSLASYRSYGSKDESFYDTQAWLDSDCDDDFYSVNGDFTPSRGSTPVHGVGTPRHSTSFSHQTSRAVFEGRPHLHSASNRSRGSTPIRRSISSSTPQINVDHSETALASNPGAAATTKRKKLADLFRESMRERGNIGLTSPNNIPNLPPKSAPRTPSPLSKSVSNNPKIIPNDGGFAKVRCFPRLVSIRSFHEHKKESGPPMS